MFIDDNGNGVIDSGEVGIAGVTIELLGVDVFGNEVNLTTQTDSNGQYAFTDLNAGSYQLIQTQPEGFDDGLDFSGSAETVGNDQFSGINLNFGQSLTGNNFGELLTGPNGTSGSPARLPALAPIFNSPISNLISSFLGSPGPIYSGIPINSNANPLTLDSGRPVTGGYVADFASPVDTDDLDCDCDCPEVIATPDEPVIECDNPIVEEVYEACDVCEDILEETTIDYQCPACEESVACEQCEECGNCCDCGNVRKGFLFRFKNWMGR